MTAGAERPSRERWFDTAGPRLHALEWPAAGDALLCLHGAGAHAHWWDALVPSWDGWHVVAPDLRGHGESQPGGRYLIEDFAADCLAVLDALGGAPIVLVGHSMGGRVATWMAAHHPARVRALILLDARIGPVPRERAERWRAARPADAPRRSHATRAAAEATFRLTPPEPGIAAPLHAMLAHHAVGQAPDDTWRVRFDRAVLRLDGSRVADLLPLLARVRCPALLLRGADSSVIGPTQAAAMHAALPQAVHETLPGGHHFLLAHPRRVAARVAAFLATLR